MHKFLLFTRQAVIYFFIILFVYAAVSKLTDFENFQVQVAQSPLLSAFATFIAYATVIGELIIAILLCIKKTQRIGLYLFLGMMTAFTVYIYLILNYSPFVPCSCGGILEKMGWTEHLWFNVITSIVAAAIILYKNTTKTSILLTIGTIIISSAVVGLLFMTSEHIMKKENPFVRRFLPHYIDRPQYLDLKVNSYYIAGLTNDTIYLGNYTAPLLIKAVPLALSSITEHTIQLQDTKENFQSLKVSIVNDLFFVSDGSIPAIFQGSIHNWNAVQYMRDDVYFSLLEPIDKNNFLFRSQRASNGEHVLGLLNIDEKLSFKLYEKALQKQIDGVFDTDGQLITDRRTNQAIYVYNYRNQFLIFDPTKNAFKEGKTIDTTSLAKIKVTELAGGERRMSAPAQKVNATSYAYNGLLYIKSQLMGKNESRSMWRNSIIIDVYDYNKNEYRYSFYSDDLQQVRIREFAVNDNYFFGLVGSSIVRYDLKK